jgi:hypothetical protein
MEAVRTMVELTMFRDKYFLYNHILRMYFIVYFKFSAFGDDWMSRILCKIIYHDMI